MSLVRANGITLHVQELAAAVAPSPGPGDGRANPDPAGAVSSPTAVLLHGLAADTMASWYFTLAYPLAEWGFRVLLQDLRGHGRSERPARGYALDDFVDDLDALLEHDAVLNAPPVEHPRRVCLFGNSFGGTVAFAYAARHPDRVAGIVAVEAGPPTAEWFERMRRRLADRPARARRPALVATSLLDELPASVLPEPASLAAIRCPVLCLYGERSPIHQLTAESRRLLPRVHTRVFGGQRHSLLVDQPVEVRAAVTDWLRDEFTYGG